MLGDEDLLPVGRSTTMALTLDTARDLEKLSRFGGGSRISVSMFSVYFDIWTDRDTEQ